MGAFISIYFKSGQTVLALEMEYPFAWLHFNWDKIFQQRNTGVGKYHLAILYLEKNAREVGYDLF